MPALFSWLISALIGVGVKLLPYASLEFLKALGFGLVTLPVMSAIITQIETYILSEMSGLPADVVGLIGLARVDDAMNVIIAAVVTRAAWQRIMSGSTKLTISQ